MTRPVDSASRSQLLDRILTYAFAHGVASLSLRPLAKQLGITPGLLLYHFGSKEDLTVEILKHAGDRQRALFASLRAREDSTPLEICNDVWRVIGSAQSRPLFRLSLKSTGSHWSMRNASRIFPAAIDNWLDFLERPYVRGGMSPSDARVRATIVLAGFRGFLLDLCATGDHERVDRAVVAWIETLA